MDLKGKIKKQRKRENKHSWLKTYVDPKRAIFWTFVMSEPDWLSSIKIVKLIQIIKIDQLLTFTTKENLLKIN